MPLEYKSVPFEVKEVIDVSGGGWEIAGYASTFGGSPDAYGDVIVAGAFADSIATRGTKFLYEHREPIGKQLEIREDDKGLFGRWSIVDTQTGTDAYKLARAGVLDSLSIGYFTKEADYREDGVRLLRKVDLYEVSAVAVPANTNAVITDVKADEQRAVWSAAYVNDLPDSAFALILPGGSKDAEGKTTPRSLRKFPHHDAGGNPDLAHVNNGLSRAPQADISDAQRERVVAHLQRHKNAAGKHAGIEHDPLPFDLHSGDVQDAVAEWIERVRSGAEQRTRDGRELSEARKALLVRMSGSLRSTIEAIDALLVSSPPAETINIGAELRRRRYMAAGLTLERHA